MGQRGRPDDRLGVPTKRQKNEATTAACFFLRNNAVAVTVRPHNKAGLTRSGTDTVGGRVVGVIQMAGGALEIALGAGAFATPTGVTQVGGVILIAHGADTFIAGFRSIWSDQVQQSFTQQGAAAAAKKLGASDVAAQRIGTGADLVAGVGPSLTIGVMRRLAIAGAGSASERVAVAYLHRGALEMGHNAVGIRQGGTTAWIHFAGMNPGRVIPVIPPPGAAGAQPYILTELAITTEQAGQATAAMHRLRALGPQEWALFGPNCTTTVREVLQQAGIVVPAWSQSPFLLHLGINVGPEITVVGGTAAVVGGASGGSR